MKVRTSSYGFALSGLPSKGRHILGQFDGDTIVLYIGMPSDDAARAVAAGRLDVPANPKQFAFFGPEWIGVLWQTAWNTPREDALPPGKGLLAVTISRENFDALLRAGVPRHYEGHYGMPSYNFESEVDWRQALNDTDVQLVWSPEHHLEKQWLEQRGLLLGARGELLRKLFTEWPIQIEDVMPFARQQYALRHSRGNLLGPCERVYVPSDAAIYRKLGLSCRHLPLQANEAELIASFFLLRHTGRYFTPSTVTPPETCYSTVEGVTLSPDDDWSIGFDSHEVAGKVMNPSTFIVLVHKYTGEARFMYTL